MTKVVVVPKVSSNVDETPSKKSKASHDLQKEWTRCFNIEFDNNEPFFCDQFFRKCNTLTSIELSSGKKTEATDVFADTDSIFNGKYLAQVQALKSPMQSYKTIKSSNAVQLTKFLQSIENSYPPNFYYSQEKNSPVYAMLNLVNFSMELITGEWDSSHLKMSNFLRQQLKLFQYGSKVVVKAQSIDTSYIKSALSCSTSKTIVLKPNRAANV
jgi:hypothetical protein